MIAPSGVSVSGSCLGYTVTSHHKKSETQTLQPRKGPDFFNGAVLKVSNSDSVAGWHRALPHTRREILTSYKWDM